MHYRCIKGWLIRMIPALTVVLSIDPVHLALGQTTAFYLPGQSRTAARRPAASIIFSSSCSTLRLLAQAHKTADAAYQDRSLFRVDRRCFPFVVKRCELRLQFILEAADGGIFFRRPVGDWVLKLVCQLGKLCFKDGDF